MRLFSYCLAGLWVYLTISQYYAYYGKGQKAFKERIKEEEKFLALPLGFKSNLFLSIGFILMIVFDSLQTYKPVSTVVALLPIGSALSLLAGCVYFVKYEMFIRKHKNKATRDLN